MMTIDHESSSVSDLGSVSAGFESEARPSLISLSRDEIDVNFGFSLLALLMTVNDGSY